jgi:hypothetical protein
MLFDVPVIAYDAGAVAETLRGGGVLLTERRLDVIAELIHCVIVETALRSAILATQRNAVRRITETDFGARVLESLLPIVKS